MKTIFIYIASACLVLAGNTVYALSVNQTSLSISSGETDTFTLTGGSGYYNIKSSDDTIASASFIGNTVNVTGVSKGTAIITVDDGNDVITVQVDVDASIDASEKKIDLLNGQTKTITIINGKPPFQVNSTPVATAAINANSLTITGVKKGTAKIIVTDNVSDSVLIDVNVYLPLKADSKDIFLAENTSNTLTLSEGVPPYYAASNDDSIADVSVNGNTVSVNGKQTGDTELILSDSAPTPNIITVNVNVDIFNVSTRNFYIKKGNKDSFDIIGTGLYNISVSDDTILSAVITGSSVMVTGLVDGSTIITISDSNGNSIDVKAIVSSSTTSQSGISTSKSSLVMNEGASESITILGGIAPYKIISSKSGIVDTPKNWGVVPFTVTATGQGKTVLTISDTVGSSTSLTITVLSGSFGISKKQVVLVPGTTETINVFGGTGFYKVTSSDSKIAEVQLGTGKISIKGISAGKAVINVQDSNNASADIDVTTLLPAPKLDLSINAKTITMTWDIISGADSYVLYYAPPASGNKKPDITKLAFFNIGDVTSLTVDMNTGDAYFIAVQAVNSNQPDIASTISNIKNFKIP